MYKNRSTIHEIWRSIRKIYKIIHYLLKSYQITYNYDEFYQCLLIKMWQLILNFDEQQSSSLHSYLFIQLKFYLIDTFRKESLQLDTCNTDILNHIDQVPTTTINDSKLLLEEITQHLSPRKHLWLFLFLQDYKQYEIAQLMSLSLSTIKKLNLPLSSIYNSTWKNNKGMSNMKCMSTQDILYIQTAISSQIATLIQHALYQITLPSTTEKMINYLLELHQKFYQNQIALAKWILNINKLIPIYINSDTILFPLTQKRASIKYYINARKIIGINSSVNQTIIVFENSTTLQIDIPYTLVAKK